MLRKAMEMLCVEGMISKPKPSVRVDMTHPTSDARKTESATNTALDETNSHGYEAPDIVVTPRQNAPVAPMGDGGLTLTLKPTVDLHQPTPTNVVAFNVPSKSKAVRVENAPTPGVSITVTDRRQGRVPVSTLSPFTSLAAKNTQQQPSAPLRAPDPPVLAVADEVVSKTCQTDTRLVAQEAVRILQSCYLLPSVATPREAPSQHHPQQETVPGGTGQWPAFTFRGGPAAIQASAQRADSDDDCVIVGVRKVQRRLDVPRRPSRPASTQRPTRVALPPFSSEFRQFASLPPRPAGRRIPVARDRPTFDISATLHRAQRISNGNAFSQPERQRSQAIATLPSRQ
jgi:hypothetical protein